MTGLSTKRVVVPDTITRLVSTKGRNTTQMDLTLILSAAVVGVPFPVPNPLKQRPLLEMCWRALMAQTNLKPDNSLQAWTKSAAYNRLDPSEKSAVSHFLGMVQSRLLSLRLGYSHPVHVDRLLQRAGKPLIGSRPDFLAVSMVPMGNRSTGLLGSLRDDRLVSIKMR